MAITLSILNGFSKPFHCWKANYISNKIHIILPITPSDSVCCHTTLRNFEVWNCGNFQKKQSQIVSHLTQTETSFVIWLNIVTIVARSDRLARVGLHARRRPFHSSLHCQWWSGQCHAKHAEKNAVSIHNTCLDKIVCYLQRIFNRNWELKQQVSK